LGHEREKKYDWLKAHENERTDWQELKPTAPFYLFVPRDEAGAGEYLSFCPAHTIFPVNVTGIVTARDTFVLDFDRNALLRRIGQFRDSALADDLLRQAYRLKDTRGWKLTERRKDLAKLEDWQDYVVPCLYRPFDSRNLYYHPYMVDWGRPEVMRHMLAGENLALVAPRQHKDEFGALATDTIGGHKSVAAYDINYYFPLYLYPDSDRQDLFAHLEPSERRPNLNPAVLFALAHAHGKQPTPEDIFHYIYAVLYAPSYRSKYAEFLRMDFPRIPFTADAGLFAGLASLGAKLVGLHLLKSPELDPPLCRFDGESDCCVNKDRKTGLRYEPAEQRVYVNATQYFAPVPEAVWSYQAGGYQVCEKWLKDRRERRLELDDIRTYCRIVTALARTMEIQQEIDALYPGVESNLIEVSEQPSEPAQDNPTNAST
jgi:predicted helicase